MTIQFLIRRMLFVATFVAILAAATVVLAQKNPLPVDDDEAPEVNLAQPQPVFMVADENFDQWLYQEFRNAAGGRSRLESLLALRIEAVAQACELSDEQRQKLQLAGRGDIKRFTDRVEELRRKFQAVKTDQNRIQELLRDMQPYQTTIRNGPFDDSSFFSKTVKNALTADQKSRLEAAERDRRRFGYQAAIENVITLFDETLALRAQQREALEKLLLEETRPPVHFGPYDIYVVMLQASQLGEEKLKPLLDPPQWKRLQRLLDKARTFEPMLKANGILPEVAPADGAPPAARVRDAVKIRPAVAVPVEPAF